MIIWELLTAAISKGSLFRLTYALPIMTRYQTLHERYHTRYHGNTTILEEEYTLPHVAHFFKITYTSSLIIMVTCGNVS